MTERQLGILLLCEGDAESWNSWSGTSRSVLEHLRAAGHSVIPGDVDLYGLHRLVRAAREFSPSRRRWWVKYHLMAGPFRARSAKAQEHLARHAGTVDVILQFGATFEVVTSKTPIVLYCDGNIANSKRAMAVGQSEAAFLTAREIEGVLERERRVYAGAARILTLSERLRQSFIEDFQIPEERVRTIFAGPNFDVTRIPSPSSKVRPGPPTVLFVGRQFQRKGGDILLEAFRLLKQRLPDARLVIVGPTDLSVDISGVEMLGLLDKSTPDGWAALRKAYESAHVFCMPTRYEGLSISFLEAMYFGLPCVSTFTEWWQPEMIVDGETGLIVPLDDVEALCEAMLSLLTNPEKARAMGMAGRKRAEEIFHWPAVIDRMCEELRAAADSVGSGRELDACSER